MKKEFKLDLERLHNVALGNISGRACGKTTLFIYNMIGVALTNAFSFTKESKVVYIPFSRPARSILNTINQIEEICGAEKVPFTKCGKEGVIVILDTAFAFVRNYAEDFTRPGYEEFVWWNNDCCVQIEEDLDRVFFEIIDSVTLPGMKFKVFPV